MKTPRESIVERIQSDFGGWGDVYSTGQFMERVTNALDSEGFSRKASKLVCSVCPDDINRLPDRDTIEKALVGAYGGEFHLGSLAGYPICGVMGMVAASHHVPDGGNLVILISAHVGMISGNTTLYGKVMRPGQSKPSAACGAMVGFLGNLKKAGNARDALACYDSLSSPSEAAFFPELVNKEGKWLDGLLDEQDENQQMIALAKKNYEFVVGRFNQFLHTFIKEGHFKGRYAIIGGLNVNTRESDYFILKDLVI